MVFLSIIVNRASRKTVRNDLKHDKDPLIVWMRVGPGLSDGLLNFIEENGKK